ncbi:response regulator [Candidatus Saccharibacteria bacterium]|nr:response regulator [Candidatus Saccharibacteria bacterium]
MEPKKIVVIEDDVALAEIYAVKLRANGQNNVLVAHDGDAGLALVQAEKPDLVISDVMMPKMSGFDMLDILRSHPETAHAKVILMTALSGDAEKSRGEELKADRYFVKSGATIDDLVASAFELLAGGPQAVVQMVDPATAVTSNAAPVPPPPPATDPAALTGTVMTAQATPSAFAADVPATPAVTPVAPVVPTDPNNVFAGPQEASMMPAGVSPTPQQPTPAQGIFSAPK